VSGARRMSHIYMRSLERSLARASGSAAIEALALAGRQPPDTPTVHAGIVLIAHRLHP